MNIKDFSNRTGMTPYTLRYYEKLGLLGKISRDLSGHRLYNQKDILWCEFIQRLKETNMSLSKIKEYAELREIGNSTIGERALILEEHKAVVMQQITQSKNNLNKLEHKIEIYKKMLSES